jgi:transposase
MLSLPPRVKVFAALAPTDMRKSFHGLVGIVEKELGHQVEGGDLFLFFNRRRDRLKVLCFTGDGLLILYKKLEVGTFESLRAPESPGAACSSGNEGGEPTSAPCLSLRGRELALLLEGIELSSVKRRRWWRQE